MKEHTKSEWEEIINEFGENVKRIIKDHYLEGKTTFEIKQEYKTNKSCLRNLEIMFYEFYVKHYEKQPPIDKTNLICYNVRVEL